MMAATSFSAGEAMLAALEGEKITMSNSKRIIERAGAQWIGVQKTDGPSLILFRDPVVNSCLAIYEKNLTVEAVKAKMKAARETFGAIS